MKKKAWLPVLSLTTGMIPGLSKAVESKTVACESEEQKINLSFYAPEKNSSGEWVIRTTRDDKDTSAKFKFDDFGAYTPGEDEFVSPKGFKVTLFYYKTILDRTTGREKIVSEDIGTLEGALAAGGKWNVSFTPTNEKPDFNKGPIGQAIPLDCKTKE